MTDTTISTGAYPNAGPWHPEPDWHGDVRWVPAFFTWRHSAPLAWRHAFGSRREGATVRARAPWSSKVQASRSVVRCDARGRVFQRALDVADDWKIGVVRGSPADVWPRVVVSGGQTGADRGALDAAVAAGWPVGGWCPRGWRAEDGALPEEYRSLLWQHESPGYEDRTRANVRDSDGTLLVSSSHHLTGGSLQTWEIAGEMGRPRLHVVLRSREIDEVASSVGSWVYDNEVGVLNVAGKRESRQPGIYEATRALIVRVLSTGSLRPLEPLE